MVDIGIVGLDTSHSESFAATIQEHGLAELTAVWDGGAVRSDAYADRFCERYEATRFAEPLDLVSAVDAVLILTVNWDTHRELAVPFLERGVPTLVDKPIAGSLEDVRAIRDAIGETPFFGGSAVPYQSAVRSLDSFGDQQTVYCIGYDDTFYYGSHVIDTVRRLAGAPWTCASRANDPGQTVDVAFEDGTYATVRLDDPSDDELFTFFSIGERTVRRDVGSSAEEMTEMYENYIDTFLEVVAGARNPADRVLDAASLLLAVNAALEHPGPITPNCRILSEYSVDGAAFLAEYEPYY
ncbi:Gfo/Idh/MocA family protein [Natrononativus amylolyticus]|uniref:Gfo/Idh/MocA family protein n=1 Tax=Natrononativus amylolyticus TaxID=2963434 RepID=UPI0020CC0958|nr:Gfo/Idh/MocA family oxidoreductase [Natrononativus amylolyticus]